MKKTLALVALGFLPLFANAQYQFSSGSYGTVNFVAQQMVQQAVRQQNEKATPAAVWAKGGMSDRAFVEKTLDDLKLPYAEALKRVPTGQIDVIMNDKGWLASISPGQYDPRYFTYL